MLSMSPLRTLFWQGWWGGSLPTSAPVYRDNYQKTKQQQGTTTLQQQATIVVVVVVVVIVVVVVVVVVIVVVGVVDCSCRTGSRAAAACCVAGRSSPAGRLHFLRRSGTSCCLFRLCALRLRPAGARAELQESSSCLRLVWRRCRFLWWNEALIGFRRSLRQVQMVARDFKWRDRAAAWASVL